MKYIIAIIFCLALTSCFEKDVWKGFLYPDKGHLVSFIALGEFESLEACRDAAIARIRHADYENADYECGLNCKRHPDMAIDVCNETLR